MTIALQLPKHGGREGSPEQQVDATTQKSTKTVRKIVWAVWVLGLVPLVWDCSKPLTQELQGREHCVSSVEVSTKKRRITPRDNLPPHGKSIPKQQVKTNFTHFYSHIPKVGGNFIQHAILEMLQSLPEWQAMEKKFTICNAGTRPTTHFQEDYPKEQRRDHHTLTCDFWMSESKVVTQAAGAVPHHTYTMVRPPQEHVLSQYFHCTESTDHRYGWKFMPPSLDEWLDRWVQALSCREEKVRNKEFQCYNPINLQSRFVHYAINETTKQDLARRFDVIGDLKQIEKTACLVFAHYTGVVAPQCDCTNVAEEGPPAGGVPNYQALPPQVTHSVTHHGGTYPPTLHQQRQIALLTQVDESLYRMALEVFQEQIKQTEEKFQVKFCNKFRNVTAA